MLDVSRPFISAILALQLGVLAGCDGGLPAKRAADARAAAQERAAAKRSQAACASQAAYDRLKQLTFDQAIRLRNADPANLGTLADYATVRMENPVVASHDESLQVTVCRGNFVLYLPPGAEKAFGGDRQLQADVEYAAQPAADGSGLVYQLRGAEPIVYKLAAFDLKGGRYAPAGSTGVAVASRGPEQAARSRDEPPPLAQRAPPIAPVPLPQRPPPPPPAPPPRPAEQHARATPSFNCNRARTGSERMVCSSSRLASLDRAMAARYYAVMDQADLRTRTDLRRSRDRFLAYRERCPDESCVAQAYRDRIEEIGDIAADR